jgi:hypothetical protein
MEMIKTCELSSGISSLNNRDCYLIKKSLELNGRESNELNERESQLSVLNGRESNELNQAKFNEFECNELNSSDKSKRLISHSSSNWSL